MDNQVQENQRNSQGKDTAPTDQNGAATGAAADGADPHINIKVKSQVSHYSTIIPPPSNF